MDWINVKDKLFLQGIANMDWVLVTSIDIPNPIAIARFDGKKWEFLDTNNSWTYAASSGDSTCAFDLDDITHWMPLPNPPRSENE